MDFNKQLGFKESIFALAIVVLFVLFVVSPTYTGGEPDKNLFMILWFIGFIFVFTILSKIFIQNKNYYLPEYYKDLKIIHGKPLATIYPQLWKTDRHKWYERRLRMLLKVEIYVDFIIISFFDRAVLIDKKENLKIEDNGILGTTITVCNNDKKFKLNLSVFQWNKMRKNLSWYYDNN